MTDKPCGRTLLITPDAVRMCHLPANHDGQHSAIYQGQRLYGTRLDFAPATSDLRGLAAREYQ